MKIFFLTCLLITYSANIYAQPENQEDLTAEEQKALSKIQFVKDNNIVNNLTPADLGVLPIGIAREINDKTYIIAIDSAYADERGWFLTAYAAIDFPGGKTLVFAGKGITFDQGGIAVTTNTRLSLLSTQEFELNNNITLQFPGDGSNFLEFNCNGFQAINLHGRVVLNSDTFIPDKATNAKEVSALFTINTTDLNNILLNISLSPFQIKGLDDVTFSVQNATLDFSDYINPPDFTFPANYQNTYGPDITLWRGLYFGEVSVTLPHEFDNQDKRTKIAAQHMLIDENGFAGIFSAENLIAIDKGSANGWPMSVNKFYAQISYNKLTGGGFAGEMHIPFLKGIVGYDATMFQSQHGTEYRFAVAIPEGKKFTVPLAGEVSIDKGSIIAMERRNNKFYPSAVLHGNLTVNNSMLNVDKIRFENLTLVSEKPYVTRGNFAINGDGQSSSANFPIRIDSIQLGVYREKLALSLRASLNLMNSDDKGFSAETFISVLAKMNTDSVQIGETKEAQQKWEFEKVKVEDIMLDCNTTALTLKGRLSIFDEHPVYGNGFSGKLSFAIKNILERGIRASAYFGSKSDFRYWHVDAYVPTGQIPIIPPLSINGIMGGMSYNMKRQQTFKPNFADLNKEENEEDAEGISNSDTLDMEVPYQNAYVPDRTAARSFMAGVTLIAANESVFNGDIILEVAFRRGGGIKYANFTGNAYLFNSLEKRDRASEVDQSAPIYANLNMLYDNDNDLFHANLKTYMNIRGSLRGIGPNNLVGEAVMHFDPQDWYIYVGRPSQMFGVTVAGLATARSYFMVGTQIEDIPNPPSEVAEMFYKIDVNIMRNESALKRGGGIAAGVHFEAGFDSEDKLRPFYAMLKVGGGVDFMLRDNGETYCLNRNGTQIGISGWYATGQAYVYMMGSVGLEFKKGKRFDILSLGAAALLQAKLPNPTYMQGGIAGRYKILGGLIKGKFNLTFEMGEECERTGGGGELGDLKVIASVKPDNGNEEVSVFTAPEVAFNLPVETEIPLMNIYDNLETYRIKIEELSLLQDGNAVDAEELWNTSKDVVRLKTVNTLPSNANMAVIAKAYWQKKTSAGSWESLTSDGSVVVEEKRIRFSTGNAPDVIDRGNIEYSYPLVKQYNIYKDEFDHGYIKMIWNQHELFENEDELTQYKFVAKIFNNGGEQFETNLQYLPQQQEVRFKLPDQLKNNNVYELNLIKRPMANTEVGTNTSTDSIKSSNISDEVGELYVNQKSLTSTSAQAIDKVIYQDYFRVSNFNTFTQKMNSIKGGSNQFDIARGNVYVIAKRAEISEVLDKYEVEGITNKIKPLIRSVAATDNTWYSNYLYPTLYEHYHNNSGLSIDWRDVEKLGVPPLKASKAYNPNHFELPVLAENEIQTGIPNVRNGNIVIAYFMSYFGYWDYKELIDDASNVAIGNNQIPIGLKRLLESPRYKDLTKGNYKVNVGYYLPGQNKPNSSSEVLIEF
jgi:hypothetical protein